MTVEQKLITTTEYEDFLAEHPDGLYELIHGKIIEKMVTQEHSKIAGIIIGELYIYLRKHPKLKAHMGPEARFSLEGDELNDRLPDVSVHLTDKPPVAKGAVNGMPDLAVEIKPPTNTIIELREKARFYLENGCRIVWIIYLDKQLVELYHVGQDIEILMSGDIIKGADVLPNFELAVDTLFPVK
jgi:Uma2 family endonuclease